MDWIKAAPWIGCAVLALLLAIMSKSYLDERDEFTAYRAVVEALGKKAAADKVKIEAERDANLEKVKRYEKNLPAVRADAVAAYRLRFGAAGSCPVSGASPGLKLDDVSGKKLLATDGFIQDCADDAAKLTAWREWATLNRIPVKE